MDEVSAVVCGRCGQATRVLCTCLGCRDAVVLCACQEVTDANVANEGCCGGCVAAGCVARMDSFARCQRLAP